MTEIAPLLGVLAGAIGVADMIPYVRDTLRGTTRPHRGTWLIWGALGIRRSSLGLHGICDRRFRHMGRGSS
jgi:hypothetical protein